MAFKFEKLDVWQESLVYVDLAYRAAAQLPDEERYNLASQLRRAATSISLNIAEGSTGQTDAEQARFLGLALRSLVETVACIHLIQRRDYRVDVEELRNLTNLLPKSRNSATHWSPAKPGSAKSRQPTTNI